MDALTSEQFWFGVSVLGQTLFTGRFLVQWLHSERKRKSIVPIAFWYLSLAGGATLLTYMLHRGEYVLALGQATPLIVYFRNLMLIWRERRAQALAPVDK
jgi:lipid-A-disaccharide synthase-like uncharacterized protein